MRNIKLSIIIMIFLAFLTNVIHSQTKIELIKTYLSTVGNNEANNLTIKELKSKFTIEIYESINNTKIVNGLSPEVNIYAENIIKDMPLWKTTFKNGETTITNNQIINQYISNVKSFDRFNKMPGTPPQNQKIRISVKVS